jgi:hypothetical protein
MGIFHSIPTLSPRRQEVRITSVKKNDAFSNLTFVMSPASRSPLALVRFDKAIGEEAEEWMKRKKRNEIALPNEHGDISEVFQRWGKVKTQDRIDQLNPLSVGGLHWLHNKRET